MPYNIIVGRNPSDLRLFGDKATIFLGKQYVQMGNTTSLSNRILLDIARPHVILVSGKRGTGKSYSLSVIAEEIISSPKEISKNIAIIILDTMGIFWTMKYENSRESDLLQEWGLTPKKLNVNIYTPQGYYSEYKKKGIPTDVEFTLKTSELKADDWCNAFNIELTSQTGVLIERILAELKSRKKDFTIEDILNFIRKDKKVKQQIKNSAENRFIAAKSWGLFSNKGLEIKDLSQGGKVSIVDTSCYTDVAGNWGIKNLVIGLIAKKILQDRIQQRKYEELETIKTHKSYFYSQEEDKEELPQIWLIIDEAHEILPREIKTAATDSLVQLLREGRQPGISMVLATQQPGEIHRDVITQSDIVISHRVTAKRDITSLNNMMQSYLHKDLLFYLNTLPKQKGSAIILDDNSERIYPMKVRPRFTWHGGESPSAIKIPKRELMDLDLDL